MTENVLVTGATGGIGRALCLRLAAHKRGLVIAARDKTKLDQFADELRGTSDLQVTVLPVDMSSDMSVAEFGRKLLEQDIRLAGAVLMPPQPHRSPDALPENEDWRKLFQESFIGPLALLKHAVAAMYPDPAAGRRAKIVIVSGISSVQVLSHYATANVIRCAWVGQAKTMAFALGPRGIHVNTLSLGGTLSPWYKASIEQRAADNGRTYEQQLVAETDNVPLGKYGEPREVAIAIEGLLSSFSDHMSGLNITHDGGFTRAY